MSDDQTPEPRTRPREDGPEKDMLCEMLDFLRATAINKVIGLSNEQATSRPIPATSLTPAGLLKHLGGVERFWFSIDFAGADLPWPWPEDDQHGAFALDPGESVGDVIRSYRNECIRSRQVVEAGGLDEHAQGPDMHFTLRYALTHMIEETARHCGHLDLLRESIDGSRGQ